MQHKGEAFEELRANFDVYKRTLKNDLTRVKADVNIMTARLKSNNDQVAEMGKDNEAIKMQTEALKDQFVRVAEEGQRLNKDTADLALQIKAETDNTLSGFKSRVEAIDKFRREF